MDPSRQTIDLHPERRRPTEESNSEIETSRYFAPSKSKRSHKETKNGDMDDDESQDENPSTRPSRSRQTILSSSGGRLTTTTIPLLSSSSSNLSDPKNPIPRDDPRRQALTAIAQETLTLLPGLLATRPDTTTSGFLCSKDKVSLLDPSFHPHLSATTVRVINSDTIDAALSLSTTAATNNTKPVAILNMANERTAGGGFEHGASAQEEALCYRSSLYFTLKHRHYPIPAKACIYSPTVLVIRDGISVGHTLLDFRDPSRLPVVSVISCAALCGPALRTSRSTGEARYANPADSQLMMAKMRVILRTAVRNRHRQIVLGAFGCGVFGNPPHEVGRMWAEVLREPEFQGGWWTDVVFAVLDTSKGENITAFVKELDGLLV